MKIRIIDALKYAKIKLEFYEKEWNETQRIDQEELEKSKNSIFVKLRLLKSSGLSPYDYGWYNKGSYEYWISKVNELTYHKKLGNEEFIDAPFKNMKLFYNWAAENNIPY